MPASSRARTLLDSLVVLTPMVNGNARHIAIKNNKNQYIRLDTDAAKGDMQANRDAPLIALRQLSASGSLTSTYIAPPSDAIFSDSRQLPNDDGSRPRPRYERATKAQSTVIAAPYIDPFERLMVTVFRPLYRMGQLVAVIGAAISMRDIIKTVSAIPPAPSSLGFLITEVGTLVEISANALYSLSSYSHALDTII